MEVVDQDSEPIGGRQVEHSEMVGIEEEINEPINPSSNSLR